MTAKNQLLAAMPAANVRRFTPKRKAAIVDAVKFGAISQDDVCERYEISAEEFGYWIAALESAGKAALRVTHLQSYRFAA